MATAAAPSSTVPAGSAIAEWRPAHLAGLVDLIWYYRGPTVNTLKRILPTGRLELVVNLGEPYQLVSGAGTERLASCWISGLQAGPMVVAQPARQDVVGVRLRPAGAQALLSDTPLRVVSGLHVALRDLVGRGGGAARASGRGDDRRAPPATRRALGRRPHRSRGRSRSGRGLDRRSHRTEPRRRVDRRPAPAHRAQQGPHGPRVP